MPRKTTAPNATRRERRNTRVLIGHRIAERRVALGMTQAELAEAFGVSRGAISQYEVGIGDINAGDMGFLAEILEVPVAWFYWGASAGELDQGMMDQMASYLPHLPRVQQEIILHTVIDSYARIGKAAQAAPVVETVSDEAGSDGMDSGGFEEVLDGLMQDKALERYPRYKP